MRSRHISSNKDQLNKKKRLVAFLLFIAVMAGLINKKPEDILYTMTTYFVPALTYEREFGEASKNYAASYEVPEWFYEDESDYSGNDDLAVMDNRGTSLGAAFHNGTYNNAGGGMAAGDGISGEDTLSDNNEAMGEKGAGEGALDGNGSDVETATAVIKNNTKGTTYTRMQLSKPDFLTSKIFVVDSNTSMTSDELDIKNLLDTDLTLKDLPERPTDNLAYKVLIYHTHASESFADSRPGVPEDTVVGAGAYLTKLLNEQYGIPTYHDETTYDVIDGVLDRSKAYENSYNGIKKILADNPSIEVVIDLHRDGVDEETHLVTEVNGKPTAKIMFLNGVSRSLLNGEIDYLENPNKLGNLAFSFQLYLAGKEDYGDYVRKIYVRSLRYNLHVMPRATLIEAGAQNNTIEEEMNAMEPLAAMLDKVLRNSR